MKDQVQPQAQIMNPSQQQQQMMSSSQQQQQQQQMMMSPPPPQAVIGNQAQLMMNQQQQQMLMMGQSQMMSRGGGVGGVGGGYGMWPPPMQVEQMKFKPGFGRNNNNNNKNWKGKKGIGNDKRMNNNPNRKDNLALAGGSGGGIGGIGGGGGGGAGGYHYKPPTLNELQKQNHLKAKRHFQFPNKNKKFSQARYNRFAPYAPRNTTSFLIRAKKAGGITSLVSPMPVTPAVLPTPIFSPSREVLVDMAKEEWGVDGYGSMKGLIRLRSPGNENEDEDEEEGGGSSESDVEEHVEVERRLDHDLSRFEMIYPNSVEHHSSYILENRVDDQDTHIAQLEEENLILKERLFLMEREFEDLRMRLQILERQHRGAEVNEEVVENDSEDGSESRGYGRSMEENNEDFVEENNEENRYEDAAEVNGAGHSKELIDVENQGRNGQAEEKEVNNYAIGNRAVGQTNVSGSVVVGDVSTEGQLKGVEKDEGLVKYTEANDEFVAAEGTKVNDEFVAAESTKVNDEVMAAEAGSSHGVVEAEKNAASNNEKVDDVCMEESEPVKAA